MSWYSTPLQFAYILSLLLAVIFTVRGWREEQLNQKFLGFLMLIFALELQDYTFGFSGINILWNELKGFPRGVHLLFGPVMLFYLKAQVNRNFKLKSGHLWHLLPWGFFFMAELVVYVQGSEAIERFQGSDLYYYGGKMELAARLLSYAWYFYHAWQLLAKYREWLKDRFSQMEAVSLSWFRNFLILMISWIVFREVMNVVDAMVDLPFTQDWWWNLALAGAAVYVGISGLGQRQATDMLFDADKSESPSSEPENEKEAIIKKLDTKMDQERFFLQPELTVRELAAQINVPSSELSAAINTQKGINFNDYINSWRIAEFKRIYPLPENQAYTILSIAYDCGFNSKATFNRAFKKETGKSPKEYFQENLEGVA